MSKSTYVKKAPAPLRTEIKIDPATGLAVLDALGRPKRRMAPTGRCDCGSMNGKIRFGCRYSCDPCHAKYVAADKRKRSNNFAGKRPDKKRKDYPMDASDLVLGREPVPNRYVNDNLSWSSNFSCNQPDRVESD